MSEAQIASSLPSTGWTIHAWLPPSEYSETRKGGTTFQSLLITARSHGPDRPFSGGALWRRHGHEGRLWVGLRRPTKASLTTASRRISPIARCRANFSAGGERPFARRTNLFWLI